MNAFFFMEQMYCLNKVFERAFVNSSLVSSGEKEGMEASAPRRTLYVRNLPDKLPKQKLRRLLHAAFSVHGRVVWIVAEKTMKLRGQAFITFERQAGATAALRALQGVEFMGRPMAVAYAREESDRAQGIAFGGAGVDSRKRRAARRRADRQRQEEIAAAGNGNGHASAADPTATAAMAELGDADAAAPGGDASNAPMEVVTPPNNILFVEAVPHSVIAEGQTVAGADALRELFARFAGFIEVRSVPGKDDIAFVEFTTDADAAVAMSGLDQHRMGNPPTPIKVNFAKK